MSHRTDSLWSPEIQPNVSTPRDILDLQAFALREQTDGLLSAEVRETRDPSERAVYLLLDIVVPSLNGLRQRVMTARHFTDRIYPCHLDAEALRSAEVAHSAEEFRELVRQVLHSGEIKALAQSLISRAKENRKPETPSLSRFHNGHKRLTRPAWIGVDGEEDADSATESMHDEPQGID
jgi:hypothetical protein